MKRTTQKNHILRSLAVAILAGAAQGARAGDADQAVPAPAVATLALFEEAPTIDGKIEPGEWDRATATVGFLSESHTAPWGKKEDTLVRFFLDARRGSTRVGYTRERLYIAISSEIPPDGKLIANQLNNDTTKVVGDSSIEVWLQDMGDETTLYQMIANSKGAVFDKKASPEGQDVGWNGAWEFANGIDKENNLWHAELSLPFADIGGRGDVVGRELRFMVSRNFKRPWNQITAFPQGKFRSSANYPRFRLTESDPVVQILRLGDYNGVDRGPLFDGPELDLQVRVVNPGEAREVVLEAKAHSTDMPSVTDAKTLSLPAGGSADFSLEVPEGRFQKHATNWLQLFARPKGGEDPLFAYGMAWNRQGSEKTATWQIDTTPKPHLAAQAGYYPSYNVLRIRLEPGKLADLDEGSTEALVILTDEAGDALLMETVRWDEKESVIEKRFTVDELEEGSYSVMVKFNRSKKILTKRFEREWFPWEGNMLGIIDDVLPPFTPIAVEEKEVEVVLRRYAMTGLGLWSSVRARGQEKDEAYKELLAGPMELVANEGDVLKGEGRFTETEPNRAVYEATASHPAVNVKVKSRIEEDGCMRVELTLEPGEEGQALDRLRLRIPLQDERCPLYHLSTTSLRINPAGATPPGSGRIWNNDDFPNGEWNKNFVPYLWFGAESRGLCWFADNDKGWVIHQDKKNPDAVLRSQELFRENGVLTLQCNLVQKPIALEEPRTIVFGLMASPAKPMWKDWRAFGRPEHPGINYRTGFRGKHVMQGKYPINNDWSFYDSWQARRIGFGKGHAETNEYLEKLERYFRKRNLEGWPDYAKRILTIRGGTGRRSNRYQTVYFDEYHSTSLFHEEAPTFWLEWSGRFPPETLPEMPPHGKEHAGSFSRGYAIPTAGIVPSYRDFACWYAVKWLRRGCGQYFDNSNPRVHYDTLTSSAYKLEDGRIQPSAGIWARRAYQRRIWTLQQHFRNSYTPSIMMVHMTNTHILPYMVWNECNLDLEWARGSGPVQNRFTPDLLRTESLGLKTGNMPFACSAKNYGDTKQEKHATILGLFVHGIFSGIGTGVRYPPPMVDIGYGLPECDYAHYWQEDAPLSASDPECKWLWMRRGDDVLVLLATWNPEPAEVTLAFADGALPEGAAKARTFTLDRLRKGKARRGKELPPLEQEVMEVPVKDNALRVPVAGYGYRFVRIGGEG